MKSVLLTPPGPLDPVTVLEGRVKRLDGFSYKTGGLAQFGMDVGFPDELDFDEGKMSLWVPYASGVRRDGVGDLLEVGGIDLIRHRKNPMNLFDHGKQVTIPIAMTAVFYPDVGPRGSYDFNEYTGVINVEAKSASDNFYFYQGKGDDAIDRKDEYDHALLCEQLYDMALKRLVVGGSIGYQVKRAVPLRADYERGTPQGAHLLEVLKLESSLVVMPANQDTVRKSFPDICRELCCGKSCGKPLSPYLVKSLTPYAAVKKSRVGFEAPAQAVGDCKPDANQYGGTIDAGVRKCGNKMESENFRPRYENPLSNDNTPPAEFKPGVGAKKIKDIRSKYRQKSGKTDRIWGYSDFLLNRVQNALKQAGRSGLRLQEITRILNRGGSVYGEISTDDVRDTLATIDHEVSGDRIVSKALDKPLRSSPDIYSHNAAELLPPGTVVIARTWIKPNTRQTIGVPPTIAKTGDRLTVIGVENGGMEVRVRNRNGYEGLVSIRDVRLGKSMEIQGKAWSWDKWKAALKIALAGVAAVATSPAGGYFVFGPMVERAAEEFFDAGKSPEEAVRELKRRHGKSIEGRVGTKSLPALRTKYRLTAKGLRRRVKSGRPGVAIVHVKAEDLDPAREMAEAKGLKFERVGPAGFGEKIRLIGDDAIADEVARYFGMPMRGVKSMGRKDIALHHGSYMVDETSPGVFQILSEGNAIEVVCDGVPTGMWNSRHDAEQALQAFVYQQGQMAGKKSKGAKDMKKKTKAHGDPLLGQEGENLGVEGNHNPGNEEDHQKEYDPTAHEGEIFGSQVLRKAHHDMSQHMAEHDGYMGHLKESDPDHKLMSKHLETVEKMLGDIEDHHAKEYPEYPKIDGSMKDMDSESGEEGSEADKGDSGEEDQPTPDEVVEGMDTKSFGRREIKSARLRVRRKSDFGIEGDEEPGKEAAKEEAGKRLGKKKGDLGIEGSQEPGKEASDEEKKRLAKKKKAGEFPEADTADGMEEVQHKSCPFAPHHMKSMGGAAGHCKELSTASGMDDEKRMESYHWHKALGEALTEYGNQGEGRGLGVEGDQIPGVEENHEIPEKRLPNTRKKGDPVADQDAMAEVQEGEHPHVEAVKGGMDFLGRMAREKAFGEIHRSEAGMHAKALGEVAEEMRADNAEEVQHPESNEEEKVPGEMGEKALLETLKARGKVLTDLTDSLRLVTTRLTTSRLGNG